jgi:hypothetical protein
MEDKFLNAPELASVLWINACSAERQREAEQIQLQINRHQEAQAQNNKQRMEVLAAIEARHGLEAGSLGTTHSIQFIAEGQAAKIVETQPKAEVKQPVAEETNSTSVN